MVFTGGSVGGLHKSMTRLSSSQQINSVSNPPINTHSVVPVSPLNNNINVNTTSKWGLLNTGTTKVSSGGVTVTTISPPRLPRPLSQGPLMFNLHLGSNNLSNSSHVGIINQVSFITLLLQFCIK